MAPYALLFDQLQIFVISHLLQKEASLIRHEDCTYDGCKVVLGVSWTLSFSSNTAIEGSLPDSVTSPATGSWVVLQFWV